MSQEENVHRAWLAALMPCLSHAAPRFEIGTALWNAGISGHAYDIWHQYPGVSLDLRNDLSLSGRRNPGFWLVWLWRVVYYPDGVFEYTHLYSGGTTFLRATLQWDGVTYVAHANVHSQVALRSGHLLAFWSPVDNRLFLLHPGLELRWLSLKIPLSGTAEKTTPVTNFYQAHNSGGSVACLLMVCLGRPYLPSILMHRGPQCAMQGAISSISMPWGLSFRSGREAGGWVVPPAPAFRWPPFHDQRGYSVHGRIR